jgi:serine/threonine protein kinase/uncharacterized protein YkwD
MTAPTASRFLDELSEYELLEVGQVAEIRRALKARFPEARGLAGELIQRKWLTPFQANKLLQGRGQELVLGPYRLIERLGAGGMGEVFKARHARMDRLVALKIIHKQQLASPTAVERFRREARAAAQLTHPNIVIAYDADEVGDSHFLAMEYVEGTDLAARVKQSGPLAVGKACHFIRQAALGLQHAHEKGLVHRDIKPANLLVSHAAGGAAEVVKILDFGLARFESANRKAGQLTQVGKFVGTVDFISPEQAENPQGADVRSDVYSLGCCFFYLLTGQPPFPGDDAVARLAARLLNAPPSVRKLRPEVPAALEQVVSKMMAREPARRYPTAAAVAAALGPFHAAAGPVPARREPAANAGKEGVQKAGGPVASARNTPLPPQKAQRPATADSTFDFSSEPAKESPKRPAARRGSGKTKRTWVWATLLGVMAVGGLAAAALSFLGGPSPKDEDSKIVGRQPPPSPESAPKRDTGPDKAGVSDQNPDEGKAKGKSSEIPSQTDNKTASKPIRQDDTPPPIDLAALKQAAERKLFIQEMCLKLLKSQFPDLRPDVLVRPFSGHKAAVTSLAFSADGRQIVSGSKDATVRLWEVEGGKEIRCFKHPHLGPVTSVGFTEKGARILASTGPVMEPGEKKHWKVMKLETSTGRALAEMTWPDNSPPGQPMFIVMSPDRKHYIVVASRMHPESGWWGQVQSWVWEEGKSAGPPQLSEHGISFALVAVSLDGRFVLTAPMIGRKELLRFWDLQIGKVRPHSIGPCEVRALALSSNGMRAAGGCDDKVVRVWDITERKELGQFKGHMGDIHAVAFSPDDRRVLSGGADKTLRLWEIASDKELPPYVGHKGAVISLAFSPDGKLAVSGSDDGEIRVWRLPDSVKVGARQPGMPPAGEPKIADSRPYAGGGEKSDLEKARARAIELVNGLRKEEGQLPLKVNAELVRIAQGHANNMARQDKYGDDDKDGHTLDGKHFTDRTKESTYPFGAAGENNHRNRNAADPTALAAMSWKKSPASYKTLTTPHYTETGMGVAVGKSGYWYFCQVFATPQKVVVRKRLP